METFESCKYNIRSLLQNEREDRDRGKNYFIPPSQRKYDWKAHEVKKLIDDVFDVYSKKGENEFDPYFIGGVVLSLESMKGEERSKKSFEVIDGQQRLTTIVLLLAYIIQSLKFQDRDFECLKIENKEIANHLLKDLPNLLMKDDFNPNTLKMEKQFILERSDNLAKNFEIALNFMINKKMYDIDSLIEIFTITDDDTQKLITIIETIKKIIDGYSLEELIGFTIQLLNFTWIVVTKTVSIETGFLIFEKLNTTGRPLEPQDLLKSFLFQKTNDSEYDMLQNKWQTFLDKIKEISPEKSVIFPSDFLELYLTVSGISMKDENKDAKKDDKNYRKSKREWIFDKYKNLQLDTYKNADKLLDDLISLAEEYKKIKNNKFGKYLDSINFGLGYLIVLSFYKKYPKEYTQYEKEILTLVIRTGISFLLIGESSSISSHIPTICQTIMKNGSTISETFNTLQEFINKIIKTKEEKIESTISNTGILRKKAQSTLLLELIEYHLTGNKVENSLLFPLMPSKFNNACSFEGIIEDTCSKYANFIGNVVLTNAKIKDNAVYCFKDRYELINNINCKINKLDNNFLVQNSKIIEEKKVLTAWGKSAITERSKMIAEIALFLVVNNNINKNFFD